MSTLGSARARHSQDTPSFRTPKLHVDAEWCSRLTRRFRLRVRRKAIAVLSTSGDKTLRPDMERLLRDPDLNVRTEALLYLTHCL